MKRQYLQLFLFLFTFSTLWAASPTSYKYHGSWTVEVTQAGLVYLKSHGNEARESLYRFMGGEANAKKYIPERFLNPETYFDQSMVYLYPSSNITKLYKYGSENPDKLARDFHDDNLYLNRGFSGFNCFFTATKLIDGGDPTDFARYTVSLGNGRTENKALMSEETFEGILKRKYKNIQPHEAIFGETMITFGHYHSAVFAGKNAKGETFVFTKNGNNFVPMIMKLSEFEWGNDNDFEYGEPRNYNKNYMTVDRIDRRNTDPSIFGTGYYNKK